MNDGELWSFLRAVLSQGGGIWLDHRKKSYEEYSARLDAAASDRVENESLVKLGHEIVQDALITRWIQPAVCHARADRRLSGSRESPSRRADSRARRHRPRGGPQR